MGANDATVMLMNGTDRDYFDVKLTHVETKLQTIHDDVLIIKTERKIEKRFMVFAASGIALVVSTLLNFLRG